MTSFHWAAANPNDSGYVFGTELPKLVVNEVYLEYDNDSTRPQHEPWTAACGDGRYEAISLNVWAELLNPLPRYPDDPQRPPSVNNAILSNANGTVYQLVITSTN